MEAFFEGTDFLAKLTSDAVADDVHRRGGEAEKAGDLADWPVIEGEQVEDLQIPGIQPVFQTFEGCMEELPTGFGFQGLIGIHGGRGAEDGGSQGGAGSFLEGNIVGLPFAFAKFVIRPPAHQLEEPTAEGAGSAGDFEGLDGVGDALEHLLSDVFGFGVGEAATAGEAMDDAGVGDVETIPAFGIIEVAKAIEEAGVGIECGVEELARVGCHGRRRHAGRPWVWGRDESAVEWVRRQPSNHLQIVWV